MYHSICMVSWESWQIVCKSGQQTWWLHSSMGKGCLWSVSCLQVGVLDALYIYIFIESTLQMINIYIYVYIELNWEPSKWKLCSWWCFWIVCILVPFAPTIEHVVYDAMPLQSQPQVESGKGYCWMVMMIRTLVFLGLFAVTTLNSSIHSPSHWYSELAPSTPHPTDTRNYLGTCLLVFSFFVQCSGRIGLSCCIWSCDWWECLSDIIQLISVTSTLLNFGK